MNKKSLIFLEKKRKLKGMKNAASTFCRIVSKFEKFSKPSNNIISFDNFDKMKTMVSNNYDHRKWINVYDYKNSSGNFVKDIDDNVYLDMFNNIASVPIGYNNPLLNQKILNTEIEHLVSQRYSLAVMPNKEFPDLVKNIVDNMSPDGTNFLHMGCGCGSGANENAFKAAFLYKYLKSYGTKDLDPMDINNLPDCSKFFNENHKTTSMMNLPPGAPDYKILSFKKGFHGRTMGCLSATRTKWIHKVGIPAFIWPEVDFPYLKYPYEDNLEYNKNQEQEILNDIYIKLSNHKNIAAFITEPVLSEGGDLSAGKNFFNEIRNMCFDLDVSFIVDEVQTGMGATGKLWAHSHWNLDNPPDIVSFAKKAQISGFFASEKYIPLYPYMIFNTWMGDALRGTILKFILEIINQNDLLENTKETGNYLYTQLYEFQKQNLIKNLRGKDMGTFIAFDPSDNYKSNLQDDDLTTGEVRTLSNELRKNGIITGTCGNNSIRLRPSLIFEKYHADLFLEKLENVLKNN